MKHLDCKRCGKPFTPDGRGNVCSPCYDAIVDPIARVAQVSGAGHGVAGDPQPAIPECQAHETPGTGIQIERAA